MKKIFSLIMIIVLIINSFVIIGKASEKDTLNEAVYDVDGYYEDVYAMYAEFINGSIWNDYLTDNRNFTYIQLKEKLESNGYFQACLSSANFLTNAGLSDLFIGGYDENDVKIQYYVTALCSLLMTMESNWTDIRIAQTKADATMNWKDYVNKGGTVFASLLSGNSNGYLSAAFNVCGISIELLGNTIKSLENYQSLEANASIYLMHHSLLEVIIENTNDPLLLQAAQYLLKTIDLCYIYQIEHLDKLVGTTTDTLFSVLDEVMKQEKRDSSLLSGEWVALNCLNAAANSIASFKIGVSLGEFTCDVLFKSSNTILRYYEMCTLTSVHEAIIKEIKSQDSKIIGKKDWEEIENVRDLLMNLIYVNIRGEYCVYSLLTKDRLRSENAGVFGSILFPYDKEGYERWFNCVIDITLSIQNNIKEIFPDWENFKIDDYLEEIGGFSFTNLPFIGDRSRCYMSREQACAYSQIIKNAQQRLATMETYIGEDDREIYVTLFEVNGSIVLWIAGIGIENREVHRPTDIIFGNNHIFKVIFEEIWEWNGMSAVKFVAVNGSEYSYVNLHSNGLEAFTNYDGTDTGGEAWDAFYPFTDGKIGVVPDWCRAWAWISDYDLEDINTNGMSKKEVVQEYFANLMYKKKWPNLSFDWSTFKVLDNIHDVGDIFRVVVTNGNGFKDLYSKSEYGAGGYSWPFVTWTEDSILCAADIAKNDGRWEKAEKVVDELMSYANDLVSDKVQIEDTKIHSSYKEVLNTLYNGLANRWVSYDYYQYDISKELEISYLWYFDHSNLLSNTGYTLMDLDGNGILELIVGRVNDGCNFKGEKVYDLYTLKDGVVIHLASSEERCNYYLCSNYLIVEESSGSAFCSGYNYFTINENGDSLCLRETVVYDSWKDKENPWFYGTTSAVTKELIPISANKAQQIISRYEYLSFDLLLFENYIPSKKYELVN